MILTTYAGDTLSLRVSVFDGASLPFNNTSFAIDTVSLIIPSLEEEIEGTISAGVASILIPANTLTEPGSFDYYIQLTSSSAGHVFTILAGSITVLPLPQ